MLLQFDPNGTHWDPNRPSDANDPNCHWLRAAHWTGDKYDWDGTWLLQANCVGAMLGKTVTNPLGSDFPFDPNVHMDDYLHQAGYNAIGAFSGGEANYTLDRGAYRIVVNRPVRKTAPLERLEPFVQLTWKPASALPPHVSDAVDIDGDGKPDASVTFAVPRDVKVPLRAEVAALTQAVEPTGTITRESFSSVIARVGDTIILRIPVP
jgi:hypothetical protein